MSELVLGVDGGGSQTRAWLADAGGQVLGKGQGGASNYQSVGEEKARLALMGAIRAAFRQARLPVRPVAVVCLGMAGVGRPEDFARFTNWAEKENLANQVIVLNDAQLLLWAGTPQGWGIGVISGTGSIAVACTPEGKTARTGGWGWLAGDEGSGYELGTKALHAATQAADGRGPETSLLPRILAYWQLSAPAALVARIYHPDADRKEIAGLAALVAEESKNGDEVARRIEDQAAADLARAILAVGNQLNFHGETPVAMGGGVLVHNERLVKEILRLTSSRGVRLEPVGIVVEPVWGAVRCALQRHLTSRK